MQPPKRDKYFVLIIKNGYPEIVLSDPSAECQKGIAVDDKHWSFGGETMELGQMRFINGFKKDTVVAVYPRMLSLKDVNSLAEHFQSCTVSEN